MVYVFVPFLLVFTLINPGNIQAAVDGGIIITQAKKIADLWGEVITRVDAVKKAKDDKEKSLGDAKKNRLSAQEVKELEKSENGKVEVLENELKNKEITLKNAIKHSSFPGKKMEAIFFAMDVENQNNTIETLEQEKINKNDDIEAVKVLEEKIKLANQALDETIETQGQQAKLKALADSRFRGFGFGVALGVTIDLGSNDRIDEASIDSNNIVRVDKESNVNAGFLLESHYFFTPDYNLLWFGPEAGDWGVGPFVAVQPGSDDIIEGAGIGLMLGMKRADLFMKDIQSDLGDSFNLGVGFFVNPDEQILRDDFEKNEAAPTGATEVRFKKKHQTGLVVLFSYSF